MYQRLLIVLLLFKAVLPVNGQSIFSLGAWYKIGIPANGIYKIDPEFLSHLGIDLNTLDPTTLRIYGKGSKGMLPQKNSITRPDDPIQLSLYAFGTQDGRMDNGDYFLFYGNGPDNLSPGSDGSIAYQKNLYSDTTYYFLTHGGQQGQRINTRDSEDSSDKLISHFREILVHEKDELSFRRTGRLWLESKFSTIEVLQKNYSFNAPGIIDSVFFDFHVVAESEGDCSFDVVYNQDLIGKLPIESILFGDDVSIYEDLAKDTYKRISTLKNNDSEIGIQLKFNPAQGTPRSEGYLDYLLISFKRSLALYENQTFFHTQHSAESLTYFIANAPAEAHIWDLSDHINPVVQLHSHQETGIAFTLPVSTGAPFVVFEGIDFPKPVYFHQIRNQNIKALRNREGMIITHPTLILEAERLANFHQQSSGLSVGVVTTQEVYNEFSAGAQDLTAIRDFLKYCYEEGGRLRYALLFGDGSYDYKDRLQRNTNFVPVYESNESRHPILSHSSDDYIGFFEDHEGEWFEGVPIRTRPTTFEVPYEDHSLEIGIGRLPVKTLSEAEIVVDKIIRYKTSTQALGKWRTEVAYLSDDGNTGTHMQHAELFFEIIDSAYPQYNAKKIYLDAYEQEPNHGPSPQTTEELLRVIKDGVLFVDYMGHGDEEKLADEDILTTADINKLTNRQKLPLFVTATCEFGRYDDPGVVSGAEKLLLSPDGGAIALLTTTRPVYAHTNRLVNEAFHANVFKKINDKHPRLGDVIKATKNASLWGPVNRNFALLGDPMLQLNYPEYEISFDQLTFENDTSGTMRDTLSALEKYHLSGKIVDHEQVKSDFDGFGIVTLWDIPQEKTTKGQENGPFRYEDQTNALFRGEVTIQNGTFEMEFILPKNISYKYQPGKLTMYAWNEADHIDASGASRAFVLGGTAAEIKEDLDPPVIALYLNDPSFKSGGTVGTSSLFIAHISDESGANISNNGFNQSITLTLNNQEPIVLNDFYTADPDNYKKGTILFPLQNLDPGKYNVILKVWDVHNNPTSATVQFTVSDKPLIRLYNVINYPNPVASHGETTFTFEHDREGEELKVTISLYNMRGAQVDRWKRTVDNSPRKIENLKWRLNDLPGGQLEKGIYIYRLNVTSTLDGASNEVVKRLVIIN